MNQQEALTKYLQTQKPKHKETQRWQLTPEGIYEQGKPFHLANYQPELQATLLYFKEWDKMADLEAQVLVVTPEDYEAYYTVFPTLHVPNTSNKVVVLPQINTPTNSHIADAYWHQRVKGEPIMRIHSHHCFSAYQSSTDYQSLNSGTLEVVMGQIYQLTVDIAYWLTRYSDWSAKKQVYKERINVMAPSSEKC